MENDWMEMPGAGGTGFVIVFVSVKFSCEESRVECE
jgi:hypothetical protein